MLKKARGVVFVLVGVAAFLLLVQAASKVPPPPETHADAEDLSPNVFEWVGSNILRLLVKWAQYVQANFEANPGHVIVETVAIGIIIYLVLVRTYDPKVESTLSLEEEDALIDEWKPEPLVPKLLKNRAKARIANATVVEGYLANGHVVSEGKEYLNLASYNFLGISNEPHIKEKCKQTVRKYGVGSCGPRGFYGTIDTHLDLEKNFSVFMGTEDSILYADGIACSASVIPAFAKKGDLIICDEAVNFNIESGIRLSKSNVIYFKHNDLNHLEQILKSIHEKNSTKPFKQLNRRFIVVEGLYQNRGDLAPLDRIVALKEKYKYRLILDDSMGVGVLGDRGRGSVEHWGVNIKSIDILSVTLDAAIGSVGGVCAGSYQIVDHQRLSGVGYVFSASSPPYTCVAASEALAMISREPARSKKVRENARNMRHLLDKIPEMVVEGDDSSPIILIRADDQSKLFEQERDDQLEFFEAVSKELASKFQVLVAVSTYVPSEPRPPKPSLRVLVSSEHTPADLEKAAKSIKKVIAQVLTTSLIGQEKTD